MDELDLEIVRVVQENGRASVSDIARLLRKPRTTVAARLRRLEEEGIVVGYRGVVDPAKLGYNLLAFVLVSFRRGVARGRNVQVDVSRKILNECRGGHMPLVEEAHVVTGQFDVLLKVWAKDVRQLSKFLIEYLAGFDEIQRTETMVVLERVGENNVFV